MKPAIPIRDLKTYGDCVEFNVPLERMSDAELLFMMQCIVAELTHREEMSQKDKE